MTAPTIPDIVPPEWVTEADGDNDDGEGLIHLECCDPEVALCGEPLAETDEAAEDDPGEACRVCERIDELNLPCGIRFCRVRRWYRRRRS